MMKKLMLAAMACSVMVWVSSASAADNHYLCRQVKPKKGAAKFVPIPDPPGVVVTDQVGIDKCQVKKPFLLCNPAVVGGSGVPPNPSLSYCCYLAKCLQKPQVDFTTTDQFASSLKITTVKPKYACSPCTVGP